MNKKRFMLFFVLILTLVVPQTMFAYTDSGRTANNYNAAVTRTKETTQGYYGITAKVKIPQSYSLHKYKDATFVDGVDYFGNSCVKCMEDKNAPAVGDYLAFYVGFNSLSNGSLIECGMSRAASKKGGFEPGCKIGVANADKRTKWDPDGKDSVNTFITSETTTSDPDKFTTAQPTVTMTLEYIPSTKKLTYTVVGLQTKTQTWQLDSTYSTGFNVKYTNDTYDHKYSDYKVNASGVETISLGKETKITYSQMEWSDVKVKKSDGTWVPMTEANGFTKETLNTTTGVVNPTSGNTSSVIGWSSNGNAMINNKMNFYSIQYANCFNAKAVTFEAAEYKDVTEPAYATRTCNSREVTSTGN